MNECWILLQVQPPSFAPLFLNFLPTIQMGYSLHVHSDFILNIFVQYSLEKEKEKI